MYLMEDPKPVIPQRSILQFFKSPEKPVRNNWNAVDKNSEQEKKSSNDILTEVNTTVKHQGKERLSRKRKQPDEDIQEKEVKNAQTPDHGKRSKRNDTLKNENVQHVSKESKKEASSFFASHFKGNNIEEEPSSQEFVTPPKCTEGTRNGNSSTLLENQEEAKLSDLDENKDSDVLHKGKNGTVCNGFVEESKMATPERKKLQKMNGMDMYRLLQSTRLKVIQEEKDVPEKEEDKTAKLSEKGLNKEAADRKTCKKSLIKESVSSEINATPCSPSVSELSYQDFLLSLTKNGPKSPDKTNIQDKSQETVGSAEALIPTKDSKEGDKHDNDQEENVPLPKNYPSVASFFTKKSKSTKQVKTKSELVTQVKVKVDIHQEPKQKSARKLTKGKSATVSVSRKDCIVNDDEESIEVLSSEVIEIKSSGNSGSEMQVSKDGVTEDDSLLKNVCSVEVAEDVTELERKKSFLQSSYQSECHSKTVQGTLNFSKSGLSVQKSAFTSIKVVEKRVPEDKKGNDDVADKTPVKKEAGKHKQGKKSRKSLKTNIKETKTPREEPETEDVVNVSVDEEDKEVEDLNTSGLSRGRTLRSRYRVSILDPELQAGRNSPIRMKFKRCSKSSSSGVDDNFTPKSVKLKKTIKQSKAKELLEKAKQPKKAQTKPKVKAKPHVRRSLPTESQMCDEDETSLAGKNRRRSLRLTDKQRSMEETCDDILIVDDEESEEETKNVRKKSKKKVAPSKSTPKKLTPMKSTPKKTGKVASIFLMGKKEPPKPKVILNPEEEKRRRDFLMSGIPSELKKQAAAEVAAMVVQDYPPWPNPSHVQQTHTMMQLANVNLKYIQKCDYQEGDVVGWNSCYMDKTSGMRDLTNIKNFKCYVDISQDEREKLLAEISSICPSYPVRKMIDILIEKKEIYDSNFDKEEEKFSSKDKEKSKPRRSLRKRISLDVPQVIELGSTSAGAESSTENDTLSKLTNIPTPSLLDKYQPFHSSEIVSNSVKIKKLRNWLQEWKHRLDKEARRAQLLLMKEKKKKGIKHSDDSNDWWDEEDEDFALESEDSDEDEDKLCNTVMITGPCGIGKTAAVYALATELGYKVFEVNSTSSRNGKKILMQLQEATQSHQVAKHKDAVSTPKKNKPSSSLTGSKEGGTKAVSAFTNFFKQSNNTGNAKKDNSGHGTKLAEKKKRKRGDSESEGTAKKKAKIPALTSDDKDCKSIKLHSTSLILFEEVDVVFESDQGFWSAVQNFMSTTKIPIILTSNDKKLGIKFHGKYDHFRFRTPAYPSLTSYLQLVCLAENVRTDAKDMHSLVMLCKGDVRRCLQKIHFWLKSGGASQPLLKDLRCNMLQGSSTSKMSNVEDNEKESKVIKPFLQDDDEDDFQPTKSHRSVRRLISEDELSNSALPLEETRICVTGKQGQYNIEKTKIPPVHKGVLSSGYGLPACEDNMSMADVLLQMVKSDDEGLVAAGLKACAQYHELNRNFIYKYHTSILPLNSVEIRALPSIRVKKEEKKPRRRIMTFDLYDSEASNDGVVDTKEVSSSPCDEEGDNNPVVSDTDNKYMGRSLREFWDYYDTVGQVDILEKSSDWHLLSEYGSGIPSECQSDITCLSLRKLYRGLSDMATDLSDSQTICIPKLCFGNTSQYGEVCVVDDNECGGEALVKCKENIQSFLPCNTSRCSLHEDIMPTLRLMSKMEQMKKEANIKRRFHHYFDAIGLGLRETTLAVLNSSFS